MQQTIFTIFLAPLAEQQLHALTNVHRKLLVRRLRALRTNPRLDGATKIEGMDHLYRIREGDARIIYAIRNTDLIVLAIKNRTRAGISPSTISLPRRN